MDMISICTTFSVLLLILFIGEPFRAVTSRRNAISASKPAAYAPRMQTYMVFVKEPEATDFTELIADKEAWYTSFLPVSSLHAGGSSAGGNRLVYSYQHVVSGFAARLTEEEVKGMAAKNGFLHAIPDYRIDLHTTHTPEFLGLVGPSGSYSGNSSLGRGVIIGVIDSGVLPAHPSFHDEGMPAPPRKWKGRCEFDAEVCNNKLIGARNFVSDSDTDKPIDEDGHGTHTASTAAGSLVQGASVLGQAAGAAGGMAPLAHLAIYKVCGASGYCVSSDVLAGMDAAVGDGVDVLSISLGAWSRPFYLDAIAIGAFGATRKGVFVSCSAGNSGPLQSSLSNEAPWTLTVAANTMDRNIRVTVKLGNGAEIDGESIYQPANHSSGPKPLVDASAGSYPVSAYCLDGSLDSLNVKGKIVLCTRGGSARSEKGLVVKQAGGAGMILMNDAVNAFSTMAEAHVIPASHISYSGGVAVRNYINTTSKPVASLIFKGTILGIEPAPVISSFSSRGPSKASPGILKPDITGPGVSVLAAWPDDISKPPATLSAAPSPAPSSSGSPAFFNIVSGTSMSTPHLSGIAALLKSVHPTWSPAAIKSAMMTTSILRDNTGGEILDERLLPANLFATGAGLVNFTAALDPGLIYDIAPEDYVPYLCGLGYNASQVKVITRRSVTCDSEKSIPQWELNYPSISVTLGADPVTVTRTVTNVGTANSTYNLGMDVPPLVSMSVQPEVLAFSAFGEKKGFTVTFTATAAGAAGNWSAGQFNWTSDMHVVRSPVAVIFTQ